MGKHLKYVSNMHACHLNTMYQLLKLLGNDIHAEEETKLQLVENRLKGEE